MMGVHCKYLGSASSGPETSVSVIMAVPALSQAEKRQYSQDNDDQANQINQTVH
jgi:hypothetical protein